jgi:arginyl-tRNA synthetase
MNIEELLTEHIVNASQELYGVKIEASQLSFQKTRKEFKGDTTLVTFALTKLSKKSPDATATDLGEYLKKNEPLVTGYNVIKGFLNVELSNKVFTRNLSSAASDVCYGKGENTGKTYIVEYASPNTNKPLHLGHLRNIFLGYSVAEILKACGHQVIKAQIINDRGIHICKSMLAWKKEGKNATPESTGMKGDKLVGHYYVEFDKQYKSEIKDLMAAGQTEEEAKKNAPSIKEAQEMLLKWEAGDEVTVSLWKKMNGWVYDGFDVTYKSINVDFDKLYYESDTYILGKGIVEVGLEKKVFYKKEDGSVWIDLTADGLDEKLLLRADGTSVYITQDIGTAVERYKDFPQVNGMIYTVGNEQDYHFKVLFLILKKMGYAWANECSHLSYGMVDLPSGKMKSREGTVVDADDIVNEMDETAEKLTTELGKLDTANEGDAKKLFHQIGQGALKYFILKVDPKKRMLFDPNESINFQGNTGPFLQYTHARICSILRKAGEFDQSLSVEVEMNEAEREIVKLISEYSSIIQEAGKNHSPAVLANYLYELVKAFNHFYQSVPILKEENITNRNFKLMVCKSTGNVLKSGLKLLGIEAPERM